MDRLNDDIIKTVNKLFIAVDERNWDEVSSLFSESVLLDYTSMAGGELATLTPDEIVNSWKGVLPGFDKTHHQLGNYLVEHTTDEAKVFCYGTATHYLKNDSGNNVWTVVGSYHLELIPVQTFWKIATLTFNLKYIDGNHELPNLAQQRLK